MPENNTASEVIKQCLAIGIREYVICSGARNLALIDSLLQSEDVVVWSHFEERAAAFYALGRMMDSREPVAVITTSGTAVAEVLPAVIECHYQARPLVVISADRSSYFRGTGAPQAIEQIGILGNYVQGFEDVEAEVSELFQGWGKRQPWHLNVCLDETVESVVAEDLVVGDWKVPKEKLDVSGLVRFFDEVRQGVVVMVGGLEPEDRGEVMHFLRALKVPVVADATSGLRELLGGLCIINPDKVLKENTPAKILRIGEVPVGRFWRDLEFKEMAKVEVLSITRTGFSGLARESTVIKGDISRVLNGAAVCDFSEVGDVLDIFGNNGRRANQLDELLEAYPDSEPGLVRLLSLYSIMGESLYLGNSLPIREWGEFAQREHPQEIVRANRGANGIDGQLSTWAGWTHGIDDAWILLGDLTTLYDLSAPILFQDCDAKGRVVAVINNGGGRIFDRLPRVKAMGEAQRGIIANEHAFNFESWATMWGWDYQRVDTADELEIEGGEVPLVVEIVPCPKQTAGFWEAYDKLV